MTRVQADRVRPTRIRAAGCMARMTRCLQIVFILGMVAMCSTSIAEEFIQRLPLDLDQNGVSGDVQWETIDDETHGSCVLWTVPSDANAVSVSFDLDSLGIVPNQFDELQIVFRTEASLVTFAPRLQAYPVNDMCRNWYSKIDLQPGEWTTARFDLRLDDDGIFFSRKPMETPTLILNLHKRSLGTPGEPSVRRVRIAAVRFVRHLVAIDFDPTAAVVSRDAEALSWTYPLQVKNSSLQSLRAEIGLTPGSLDLFQPDWQTQVVDLAPRERKEIVLRLTIPLEAADSAPDLYSESTEAVLTVPGSDMPPNSPLLGYRPKLIWATVPPDSGPWRPEEPPAEKHDAIVKQARNALAQRWGVPIHGPSGHPQSYIDKDSNRTPTAASWFRHQNAAGQDISDPSLIKAYVGLIHAQNFERADLLGRAWQITGDIAYAEAARDVFLEYCKWYRYLPVTSPASTSGRTRLHQSTLQTCFWFERAMEAYGRIADSPALGEDDRRRIREAFFRPEMRAFYGHNVEYSNMQVHHYQTYTHAVVLLDRYWNLVGEALYGSHGFYNMIERTFTEDGISHEAGVYHWFTLKPMMDFVRTMDGFGVDVMNDRFKRVFDGTLENTPEGIVHHGNLSTLYPRAYRSYRDPAYIPTLKSIGRWPPEWMSEEEAEQAEKQAPMRLTGNTLQPANGYLWLREVSEKGFRSLSISYIMQRDRHEHDRLHVEFYDPDKLTSEIFRITYGSKHASLMAKTFGHNTFVIDRDDQRRLPSKLAAFLDRKSLPGALIVEDSESPIWPEASFARCVALLDGVFFVGDLVHQDGTHDFDWPFYAPWEPWVAEDVGVVHHSIAERIPLECEYPFAEGTTASPVDGAFSAWVDVPKVKPGSGRPGGGAKPYKRLHLHYAPMTDAVAVQGTLPRGYRPEPGPFFFVRQGQRATARCGLAADSTSLDSPSTVAGVENVPVKDADGQPVADHEAAGWIVNGTKGKVLVLINRTGAHVAAQGVTTGDVLYIGRL